MVKHLIAIIIAYIIDLFIGDPKHWPHPVKWFGAIIYFCDKKWNNGKMKKFKGFMMLIIIILVTLFVSVTVVIVAYKIHPILGIFIEAILIATTIAKKSLKEASLLVYEPLIDGDIPKARVALSHIVGRDTIHLGEKEIVRGTIETVAENTSDGITAPLFWAFIGGAPLALVYRAVNTCDSMVGYKNERFHQFGWSSAKFDDLLNYIPARLTAFIMLIVNKRRNESLFNLWTFIRQDAKKHTSPNSGWLEATVAYLLNVSLGGDNYYDGVKKRSAILGTFLKNNVPLQKEHIKETIQIMEKTMFAYILLMIVGGVLIEFSFTWF